MDRNRRSPCLSCPRANQSKIRCAPTCEALRAYQEWEANSPWMPPPVKRIITHPTAGRGPDDVPAAGPVSGDSGGDAGRSHQMEAGGLGRPPTSISITPLTTRKKEENNTMKKNKTCSRPDCTNPITNTSNNLCVECRKRAGRAGHWKRTAKLLKNSDPETSALLEIKAVLERFYPQTQERILSRIAVE